MLYVNIYISFYLLCIYSCTYSFGAILYISTCLNPKFRFKTKRPICETGRFYLSHATKYPTLERVMSVKKLVFMGTTALIGLVLVTLPFMSIPALSKTEHSEAIAARLLSDQPFVGLSTTPPDIKKPDWYNKVTITYTVSKNGTTADVNEVASLANATLNDSRGWSQLGANFKQVASGGMFNLILSQGSLLPTYSSGCSADWSCRAGNNVVINTDRWTGASTAWNSGGGTLRDYRHMVVNHEVGHWLGHDHASCGGSGQPAPLMQQQSIDLMGCTFNPWPLKGELFTSRF